MSTPTLYCPMPAESLGSSPDFRLTAAFLPPPGAAGRLLEACVDWSANRALDHSTTGRAPRPAERVDDHTEP
jgi:hypothetical protein